MGGRGSSTPDSSCLIVGESSSKIVDSGAVN